MPSPQPPERRPHRGPRPATGEQTVQPRDEPAHPLRAVRRPRRPRRRTDGGPRGGHRGRTDPPGRSKFLSNVAVILAAQAATLDGPPRLATLDAAIDSGVGAREGGQHDQPRGERSSTAPAPAPIRQIGSWPSTSTRRRPPPRRRRPRSGSRGAQLGAAAASAGQWRAAAEGYATAVRLLDRLAARRISRRDREDLLSRFALLAGDASAAALAVGRPPDGVAILEQGRSVLWAQALDNSAATARIRTRRPTSRTA